MSNDNELKTWMNVNRKYKPTELDKWAVEAERLGISYGKLQTRETILLNRGYSNAKNLKELSSFYCNKCQ